jgi:DNA polymerase IV
LFVIKPEDAIDFLTPPAVDRLPGVGKVTARRLADLGVRTVGEIRSFELGVLQQRFGRYGIRLYELARGIDDNPVEPNRPTQSISAEDTFESDVLLEETDAMIRRLAEKVWLASRKEPRIARTVVLKLKTAEFSVLTRSHTPASPPASCEELTSIALALREKVIVNPRQKFRLAGVGLSNFRDVTDDAENLLFE